MNYSIRVNMPKKIYLSSLDPGQCFKYKDNIYQYMHFDDYTGGVRNYYVYSFDDKRTSVLVDIIVEIVDEVVIKNGKVKNQSNHIEYHNLKEGDIFLCNGFVCIKGKNKFISLNEKFDAININNIVEKLGNLEVIVEEE